MEAFLLIAMHESIAVRKEESSLKLVKIWLLWRRIMKKLVWTLWKARVKKEKNTKEIFNHNNLTRKKRPEKLYHDFHLSFFSNSQNHSCAFLMFISAHPSRMYCPALNFFYCLLL